MCALRAKKPEAIQKRLKALFYGPPGVGKTTAAIQFPKPYLIDTERGAENAEYVKLMQASGAEVFQTSDADEVIAEVTTLMREKHDFRTLIVDPITVVYADLLDKSIRRIARMEGKDEDDKEVTAFGRHKSSPDRKMKHLCNLMLRLDMNVIITSHEKMKWTKDSSGTVKEDGATFDSYAKLEYLFDLSFQIQKRGSKRVGIVKKSRIEGFEEGKTIDFSYDSIANIYGRDALEQVAKPEILASAEQVAQLEHLTKLLKFDPDTIDKWLEKAKAETWAEMPADAAAKCINFLQAQITTTTNAA